MYYSRFIQVFRTALILVVVVSCVDSQNQTELVSNKELIESNLDEKGPICPEGHMDSIIPIIYGYPSELEFAQSDSGLIALGGCEIPTEGTPNWYCKIHNKSF